MSHLKDYQSLLASLRKKDSLTKKDRQLNESILQKQKLFLSKTQKTNEFRKHHSSNNLASLHKNLLTGNIQESCEFSRLAQNPAKNFHQEESSKHDNHDRFNDHLLKSMEVKYSELEQKYRGLMIRAKKELDDYQTEKTQLAALKKQHFEDQCLLESLRKEFFHNNSSAKPTTANFSLQKSDNILEIDRQQSHVRVSNEASDEKRKNQQKVRMGKTEILSSNYNAKTSWRKNDEDDKRLERKFLARSEKHNRKNNEENELSLTSINKHTPFKHRRNSQDISSSCIEKSRLIVAKSTQSIQLRESRNKERLSDLGEKSMQALCKNAHLLTPSALQKKANPLQTLAKYRFQPTMRMH